MGELLLMRHGQTAWSETGRHTGRTDVPLTAEGEATAARWLPVLGARRFVRVLSSPLLRARHTAELAGLRVDATDDDLAEWDYGMAEGRTTPELRGEHPGWDVWRDGVRLDGSTAGETLADVAARADAVLARVAAPLAEGDVALVAHGHLLRVLSARWLGLAPEAGALLRLDAGCVAVLGHERDRRVLHAWGLQPPT